MKVLTEATKENVLAIIEDASGCDYHPLGLDPALIGEVVYVRREERETWEDSASVCIYREGPSFRVVHESSDSTGHGCRCSGSTSLHATLSEAILLGLDEEERDAYYPPEGTAYEQTCASGSEVARVLLGGPSSYREALEEIARLKKR